MCYMYYWKIPMASDYSLVSSKIYKKYTLPEALQDVMLGWESAENIKDQAKFCNSQLKCFSWGIKTIAERERWSRCSISMGLLLAAPFLFLHWAASSSGATRQSRLLKRHMAAPWCAGRVPAEGSGRMDATRGNSETLVSSLEDTGLPHLGARSHLLLDIETPGFPLQDGLRAPPGEAEGGSCSGWAPSAPFTLDLGLRAAVTPQQGLPLPPAQNVKKPPACVLTPKTVNLPSPPPGEISETLCVHLVTSLLIFGLPRLALGEDSQAG